MVSATFTRNTAAVGAVGLCGASLFGASAAIAAPEDCTYPGSIEVTAGVCQVVITADGVHTFPTTLGKVSAVIVGAGGGGYVDLENAGPYGGGGGEVLYVDTVALGTAITVDVGEGGTSGTDDVLAGDGDDTVFGAITARGGLAPVPNPESPSDFIGGDSGNGNAGSNAGPGAGAAGSPPDYDTPGPGFLLSGIPGVDSTLFAASADGGVYYGLGGSVESLSDASVLPAVVASSGSGGSANLNYATEPRTGSSADGADGVVIVRYAAPALAATGSDPAGALVFAGATAIAGAALLANSGIRRRRRRAN